MPIKINNTNLRITKGSTGIKMVMLGDKIIYGGEQPQIFTFSVQNNKATVTGLVETGRKFPAIKFPDTYNNYPVTAIDSSAFSSNAELVSITIPDSVTYIRGEAFDGTAWLNNQPNGLVYAGKVAYKYKGAMPQGTAITLSADTKGIAGGAFYSCSGLTSITIPNSVTSIGQSAFDGCSGLTSVTIPSSVTEVGLRAFFGCIGLTSIKIPDSVTSIGGLAFNGCSGLTSIVLGRGITYIPMFTFSNCTGLTSITIPFVGCSLSKEDPTTSQFKAIFGKVPASLKTITITGGTSIVYRAFQDCYGLTKVTIPASTIKVGRDIFLSSETIATINCRALSQPSGWDTDWKGNCRAIVNWGYTGP